MSSETSRVLSAILIAVAIVVAGQFLSAARYESFAQENAQNQSQRGVFDTHTGRVCIAIITMRPADVEEGGATDFLRCAPEMKGR